MKTLIMVVCLMGCVAGFCQDSAYKRTAAYQQEVVKKAQEDIKNGKNTDSMQCTCLYCKGKGAIKGKLGKCFYCSGSGKVTMTDSTCSSCYGKGKVIVNGKTGQSKCKDCNGTGKKQPGK